MQEAENAAQSGGYNSSFNERIALLALFSLLVLGVYFVLKPFITGIVFGGILAVAAWPVRDWLVRRGLAGPWAAALMLVAMLLFVLVPIILTAPGLALEVRSLAERLSARLADAPQLPAWISGLPWIGAKIASGWDGLIHQTPEAKAMMASYAEPLRKFLTDAAVGFASSVMHIGISLIVATSFWSSGGQLVGVLRDSLQRLGGERLGQMPIVAGNAVKGVFYGIVGTAAVQGALMALGLLVAGVPGAAALGFVTLILAISQFGGILINLVWGGAAWWIYAQSGTGLDFWFVVVWGLFVTFMDNLLKPMLIGARMTLPILLVILGVFGGFISFGFLGLFIGPTLLAVTYDLLAAWRSRRPEGGNPG